MSSHLLLRHSFTDPVPASWRRLSAPARIAGGVAWAPSLVRWAVPLPPGGWNCLEVHCTVAAEGTRTGGSVSLGDGATLCSVDFGQAKVGVVHQQSVSLGQHDLPEVCGEDLTLRLDRAGWKIDVGGVTVLNVGIPDTGPYCGTLVLELRGGIGLREIKISGLQATEQTDVLPNGLARRPDFGLEVAVDFIDDLLHAPYTDGMFEDLFEELASWGARSVQWIYYGRQDEGWWDGCPPQLAGSRNAALTFQQVGDIFLRAVRAAHKRGLKINALLKPFDMGFAYSRHPEAGGVRLKRPGNGITWMPHFVAERRDLCTVRHPGNCGPAGGEPITCIELVKAGEGPAAFGVQDLELLISTDNLTYVPYEGPVQREEKAGRIRHRTSTPRGVVEDGSTYAARTLRLFNLKLDQPYFALRVSGREITFQNSLANIIRVYTDSGPDDLCTLGVTGRLGPAPISGAVLDGADRDFVSLGVEFDLWPGKPTAVLGGDAGLDRTFALDAGQGFLAVARGREATPLGVLSPSYPETRAWWTGWATQALEAGADGVEVRVRNHHSPLTWLEYGFEAPVVAAFRERYGTDILREATFDILAWQKLRGESFTLFLRETAGLVRRAGKEFGLHLSPTTLCPAELGAAMRMEWDWRAWLSGGLADRVTLKEIMPGTRPAATILASLPPGRLVPLIYSPYSNGFTGPGDEDRIEERIELARAAGAAAFQLYECAAFIHAQMDRSLQVNPGVRAMLRRQFGGQR